MIAFDNGIFINQYTDENPILSKNDSCYFLFTNIEDIHRPLIGKGIVIDERFTDGMNKIYFIKLLEIMESPIIIDKFVFGKILQLNQLLSLNSSRMLIINNISEEFFNGNLFRIEAFFVRNSFEKITKLRQEYISIIKNDLNKQISDINQILDIIE